jgi:hypothetical protein
VTWEEAGSCWNVRGDIFRPVVNESGGLNSERLKDASWIRGGNAAEIMWEGRRMSDEEVSALPT